MRWEERYRPIQVLGQGTSGRAVLCATEGKDVPHRTLVVVKEIKLTTRKQKEQAIREARGLAMCKGHSNILHLLDWMILLPSSVSSSPSPRPQRRALSILPQEEQMVIVTDWANQGNLFDYLRTRSAFLPEKQIWTWLYQLADAIAYIHDMKILHRDIKSKNIFLHAVNDQPFPKIVVGDFGIAKSLVYTQELAQTAIGTPYYLSPEICHLLAPDAAKETAETGYTTPSDAWSVGCVAYEMCTLGDHPFEGANQKELMAAITKAPLLLHFDADYSSVLVHCVQSLLQRQVAKRQTVKGLKHMASDILRWNRTDMSMRLTETSAHLSRFVQHGAAVSPFDTLEQIKVILEERLGEDTWVQMYRRFKTQKMMRPRQPEEDTYQYGQCVQAWRLVRRFVQHEEDIFRSAFDPKK